MEHANKRSINFKEYFPILIQTIHDFKPDIDKWKASEENTRIFY